MTTERPEDALVPAPAPTARPVLFWNRAVYALILAFAATVPVWPYSVAWGDHPSELVGLALIAVMLRILTLRA